MTWDGGQGKGNVTKLRCVVAGCFLLSVVSPQHSFIEQHFTPEKMGTHVLVAHTLSVPCHVEDVYF